MEISHRMVNNSTGSQKVCFRNKRAASPVFTGIGIQEISDFLSRYINSPAGIKTNHVQIGDGSTQGAFHHHVNPGQRFALKVTNDTAYGVGFLTKSGQTKKRT